MSQALVSPARRVRLVRCGFVAETPPPAHIGAPPLTGPDRVASLLHAMLPEDREGFAVLHLNARHALVSAELVSIGSLNASIVHPREVFKAAILAGAAAIILGHNHPSGDPAPSEEDLSITRRLHDVGELLGIEVLDHVIVGDRGRFHSFRERGQM